MDVINSKPKKFSLALIQRIADKVIELSEDGAKRVFIIVRSNNSRMKLRIKASLNDIQKLICDAGLPNYVGTIHLRGLHYMPEGIDPRVLELERFSLAKIMEITPKLIADKIVELSEEGAKPVLIKVRRNNNKMKDWLHQTKIREEIIQRVVKAGLTNHRCLLISNGFYCVEKGFYGSKKSVEFPLADL